MNLEANEAIEYAMDAHRKGDYGTALHVYHQALNVDPSNFGLLYLMGDLATRTGYNGLAINLLQNSVTAKPTAPAYIALGCALKAEHFNKEAKEAWLEAEKYEKSAELYNNLASLYSDTGEPELAIRYTDQALELDPENPNAHWNRALAMLTAKRWKEGWPEHEYRFDPRVQRTSIRRTISPVEWDGSPGLKVAVHGEQGVGDEIMFLSMLQEVIDVSREVVIEVEPRLMDLVERSFPGVRAYANEAALKAHEEGIDAQIALGSLGKLLRNDIKDFPRAASYLVPDPDRVQYWKNRFAAAGPRPYVGVAWRGGTKGTRSHERTIDAAVLDGLLLGKVCTPIALQYGETAQQELAGARFHFYPESIGKDIDDQAAMAAACDVIVTVPQTLVHVAGAVGTRCYVLTPKGSSWRYGRDNDMPWYSSVKILRQHKSGDWSEPLRMAEKAITKVCEEFK